MHKPASPISDKNLAHGVNILRVIAEIDLSFFPGVLRTYGLDMPLDVLLFNWNDLTVFLFVPTIRCRVLSPAALSKRHNCGIFDFGWYVFSGVPQLKIVFIVVLTVESVQYHSIVPG